MRGIASRLGVSATALYQHFDSKAKILHEIRIYGAELLQTEIVEPAMAIEDPRERLYFALRAYVDFARNRRWLYSVMMGQDQLPWSQLSAEETALLLKPLRTFQAWLHEGGERGYWRPGVDVEMASFKIWLAMHGLCTMLLAGRLREDHPAFPWRDQQPFVDQFIRSMVACMEAD